MLTHLRIQNFKAWRDTGPVQLASGRFKLAELTAKVDSWPSCYRDGLLEGIVVWRESAQWCESRAKLVRADFTQAIGEHWRNRRLEWNRLAAAVA